MQPANIIARPTPVEPIPSKVRSTVSFRAAAFQDILELGCCDYNVTDLWNKFDS